MAVTELPEPDAAVKEPYPKAKIQLDEKKEQELLIWVDQWLESMISSQGPLITQWQEQEVAYRAKSLGPQKTPFDGACGDVVPAIAMAVDPIHARLDTGIFKASPVVVVKSLRKSLLKYVPALEQWIEYYQKHKIKFRSIASPRILECAKHGTMVFKTIYDRDTYSIKTYDKDWNETKKEVTRFSGPRTIGVSINDFFFPPYYQFIRDVPIVAERFRASYGELKRMEQSKKIVDCDKLIGQETNERTALEEERATSANHTGTQIKEGLLIELFEVWFDYDVDGDGVPESMVATYHRPTRTLLQLRYNWYFHQRKPYTVIPYTVTNDSIYGLGIAEMVKAFQDMLTKWHRMAQDNAYLANTVMFIAQKDAGIEQTPKIYSGKVFYVEDPSNDFKSFRAGDIYNSTLQERQNLFGLAEKRTGVSDYLTGRESPVIGSRATATSTIALIQEGTRRVEEVLENIRNGFAEIVEFWIYIWMQYGLDGVDDLVFADDEMKQDLKDFFDTIKPENVHGALAIDLTATDAANNKSVQQQTQLAVIQVMMTYLEKLLTAGQQAIEAQQTMPEYTEMVKEVMGAARKMFKDLLDKYEIRNAEEYLPDLERLLGGLNGGASATYPVPGGQGGIGGAAGFPESYGGGAGIPAVPPSPSGVPQLEVPPSAASNQFRGSIPSAGGVFGN